MEMMSIQSYRAMKLFRGQFMKLVNRYFSSEKVRTALALELSFMSQGHKRKEGMIYMLHVR